MPKHLDIFAEITGMKYKPFLCRELATYAFKEMPAAFERDSSFILEFDANKKIALSWWVSAKRTRSYPYARVYDTLDFQGKKVTMIPIFKDEGKEGDRDFLQWDTISLMSLLGVYAIIAYYDRAIQSTRYANKITEQRFDYVYLGAQLEDLLSYQSDALHWNLKQIDRVGKIAQSAVDAYKRISRKLGVEMHSADVAQKRADELLKGKDNFMELSRSLAHNAQQRELQTVQPKENLEGTKAVLTIKNYLGGFYYFTCDEAKVVRDSIYLIEGKHTKSKLLPSSEDVKDGLLKMILFSNLENVHVGDRRFAAVPILKLTSNQRVAFNKFAWGDLERLWKLRQESMHNKF